MKIVKLFAKENTKFHFGQLSLEIDNAIFHSDSMFSCLCHNYLRIYGDDGIKEFIDNFPLITSVFYGVYSNEREVLFISKPKTFFLPKILILMNDNRKLAKKIKFISLELLEKYNTIGLSDTDIVLNPAKNTAWLKTEIDQTNISLFEQNVDEKVSIDRASGASKDGSPYTVSSVTLAENAFFFFLVSEVDKKLETCIKALETFGIGGELTAGYGQIKCVAIKEFNDPVLSGDYGAHTNLSIVFPKKEEIDAITDEKAAYGLIERKGFVHCSSMRRKSCIGLQEGSVFSGKIDGNIIDVSPNDKIHAKRYGKAFLLPFKVKSS